MKALAVLLALAGAANADRREQMADKLLDAHVSDDAPYTWSAFYEACGMDCWVVGWGGCGWVEGALRCEAHIYDDLAKKTTTAKSKDALLPALQNAGENPVWLDEHRFETPARDFVDWNVTFRWDWKKKILTVLDGKKVWRKVKAPKLKAGLGVTSVAVWYRISDGGSAGEAVLRVHGEGDAGQAADAAVALPIPGLVPPR